MAEPTVKMQTVVPNIPPGGSSSPEISSRNEDLDLSRGRQQDELSSSPHFMELGSFLRVGNGASQDAVSCRPWAGTPVGRRKPGGPETKEMVWQRKRRVPKPVSRRNALSPCLSREQVNATRPQAVQKSKTYRRQTIPNDKDQIEEIFFFVAACKNKSMFL